MIFSLPNSYMLPLLATIVCVAFSLSSSLVSGIPVSHPSDDIQYRRYCSSHLSETLNLICDGNFRSMEDAYPESFGQRKKRFSPDANFFSLQQQGPTHICCLRPCSRNEMKKYCAPKVTT